MVVALLLPLTGVPWPTYAQDGAREQAAPDAATCALCHQDQADPFDGNPHAVLDARAGAGPVSEGGSCASCHLDAVDHVEAGGGRGNILAFGDDHSRRAGSEACLACHTQTHPRYFGSEHAQAGLSCADCHRVHQPGYDQSALLELTDLLASADPAARLDPASALCMQCHADTSAEFDMNERHRLEEGSLGCTSCHDPHDRWAGARLGGAAQEQTCLQCHTSMGGPFIFEHDASRVEGCTACHAAHGSPNRHMLSFQDQGQLCYSCHVEMPGFHLGSPVRFGQDANCTNCHSAIHGSNFDRFFLR